MSTGFQPVAAVSELEATSQLHVQMEDVEILLVKDGDTIHAISYYCSHEAFTLEGGTIANGCITCPYHGAEFSLSDGSALSAPTFEPIRTYPVKTEDGVVLVEFS